MADEKPVPVILDRPFLFRIFDHLGATLRGSHHGPDGRNANRIRGLVAAVTGNRHRPPDIRTVMRLAARLAGPLVLLAAACGQAASDPSHAGPSRPPASGPTAEPADGPADSIASPGSAWEDLPEGPLSPRRLPHGFWVGDEVLIAGGTTAQPCGGIRPISFTPGAGGAGQPTTLGMSCAPDPTPYLRDGAAFDPEDGRWRPIAEAPLPLGAGAGVVLDGKLYLLVYGYETWAGVRPGFVVYDPGRDARTELGLPPGEPASLGGHLATAAGRIVVFASSQEQSHETGALPPDWIYDPGQQRWDRLPTDPIAPSFDRDVAVVGDRVYLVGQEIPADWSDGPSPLYRIAALDPVRRTWRRLPDSDIVPWDENWHGADGRIWNISVCDPDCHDTARRNGYRAGGGSFDPAGDTWAPLPDAPTRPGPYPDLSAAHGDWIVNIQGWAFHTPTRSWTPIPAPERQQTVDSAVVLAGDRLLVWGGYRSPGAMTNEGIAWTLPHPDAEKPEAFFATSSTTTTRPYSADWNEHYRQGEVQIFMRPGDPRAGEQIKVQIGLGVDDSSSAVGFTIDSATAGPRPAPPRPSTRTAPNPPSPTPTSPTPTPKRAATPSSPTPSATPAPTPTTPTTSRSAPPSRSGPPRADDRLLEQCPRSSTYVNLRIIRLSTTTVNLDVALQAQLLHFGRVVDDSAARLVDVVQIGVQPRSCRRPSASATSPAYGAVPILSAPEFAAAAELITAGER